jgi:hypothetical protein
MSALSTLVPPEFLPLLFAGMLLNFEIAGLSLLGGLLFGLLLALARNAGGMSGKLSGGLITLLRSAPTFVVMFFLLNAIPQTISLFGHTSRLSGVAIVALSLLPYSVAYVAQSGAEALRHWSEGSPLAAWLFLPNITRAFFVLVMSSSAGAAIGVTEGITVILRQAQHLPDLSHRLWLYGFGIACFGITLQAGFAMVALLHRTLSRTTQRRMTQILMAATPSADI